MKVSFNKDCFKTVRVFNNKVVIVDLVGLLNNKSFTNLYNLPKSVGKYVSDNPYVDVTFTYEGYKLCAQGKAVLSSEDTFNPVLGERIAESRAKIKIYKYMLGFIRILMKEYTKILYGTYEGTGNCHTVVRPDFKGGLQDEYIKYQIFLLKEETHLKELIDKS